MHVITSVFKYWRSFLAALYPFAITVYLGAVLLDGVYGSVLNEVLDTAQRTRVFSETADSLLFLALITLIAALISIAAAWRHALARNLFIFSAVIGLLLPVILMPVLPVTEGMAFGRWLRTGSHLLAAVLAFAGSCCYANVNSAVPTRADPGQTQAAGQARNVPPLI